MSVLVLATEPPECDDTLAEVPVTDGGTGCALRVTLEAGWLEAAVFALVLVVGALFALVALNVRR